MAQNCNNNTSCSGFICTPNIVQMPAIDYAKIRNKPSIDGITLVGNVTTDELGLYSVENPETTTFEQKTPEIEWHITHKMNKYPSCTVVDSAGSVVVGEVTYLDKANLVITFSGAFSGTCYLN